jgi:GNAT superfamily N-acetyltransferase
MQGARPRFRIATYSITLGPAAKIGPSEGAAERLWLLTAAHGLQHYSLGGVNRVNMTRSAKSKEPLTFQPLTPNRWADLEALFGERGACGGCWCMWWRLTRAEFQKRKGRRNKAAFKKIVETSEIPGVLAYADGQPIGWCAVAPREDYLLLERSRTLARVDGKAVWSVTCLFVARQFRRAGVSVQLLGAAAAHARSRGATIVEGYPVEPRTDSMPDAFAWTGLVSAFRQAGFREVARRSATRPMMRLELENDAA